MTDHPAATLRISTRQLAESAYRALRVAGVPSGVADEAARDVVELEVAHMGGLGILDQVLHGAPALRDARCATVVASSTGRRPATVDRRPDVVVLDARCGSALLLATPLVEMLHHQCRVVEIRALAHPSALVPALQRRSRHGRFDLQLASDKGSVLLTAHAGQVTTGPTWSSVSAVPQDVQLRHFPAPDDTNAPQRPDGPRRNAYDGLTVDRTTWRKLQTVATRFLVGR